MPPQTTSFLPMTMDSPFVNRLGGDEHRFVRSSDMALIDHAAVFRKDGIAAEKVAVREVEGGGHLAAAHVHLRPGGEEDAVGVDEVDLAVLQPPRQRRLSGLINRVSGIENYVECVRQLHSNIRQAPGVLPIALRRNKRRKRYQSG
ncbi:hypothetical protein SPACI_034230 [Sporomusa acidovorans DSM 3132]|uniref:Uncharacterized protein n=2 Tax=Sporomusa TaxID=2375 RepID=A0ABZ3J4N1_SPOA4|nr:hypothetical protein SPACI_03810 [Sporomusa acidovorans DSM 3132]SDF32273.1 hypothetical protein SAMN04488499_104353 [Sporomusa acidovorans]